MRVLMLGWEFPPFISGGLGTACFGLTKSLSSLGLDVMFVLPRPVEMPYGVDDLPPEKPSASPGQEISRIEELEHVTLHPVDAALSPYGSADRYERERARRDAEMARARAASAQRPADLPTPGFVELNGSAYGGDLFSEVQRYAKLAAEVAANEPFDVVHAHDWMTFPAAMAVAAMKGVPMIAHVHSTEFDRSGLHVDPRICDIERRGMNAALRVIAVSHQTRNQIIQMYGIDAAKIDVVYNAIEPAGQTFQNAEQLRIQKHEKVVLFLGRITQQKGPDYFLQAARKVLEVMGNVKFIMAGTGDMIRKSIETAAGMGIGHKVLFTGFLRGDDVEKIFRMADLYVMPSVSEPFGIAPLEAMSHDVPVLISRQSGVSEVLNHVLKADFWDVDDIANKIVAVLRYPPLASTLREQGAVDLKRLTWPDAARSCINIYHQAIAGMRGI